MKIEFSTTITTAKYEFTGETIEYDGHILHRIKRLRDNLVGGWIESESNLSHEGDCFVYNDAKVYGHAKIFGNAKVSDKAEVYGVAVVYENAVILGNAKISGKSEIRGKTVIDDY